MKRILFLLSMLMVLAGQVQAQRYGATLRNKDAFIYGGAVTLEPETYLSDKIVLLLTARERMLWGCSIGNFNFQFGIGLKFIIN